jgi:hypothetical protein
MALIREVTFWYERPYYRGTTVNGNTVETYFRGYYVSRFSASRHFRGDLILR